MVKFWMLLKKNPLYGKDSLCFIGVLFQGLAGVIRQEKKIAEIGKEETKLSLFADDMTM